MAAGAKINETRTVAVQDEPGRWDAERGSSTLETLGLVVVAAVLVVGVTLGVSTYPGRISAALCRFAVAAGLDPGSCEAPAPSADEPTDEDFDPGVCMLRENSEKYSAEAKIWFFTIGESSGFVVQEFSDGTVRATLTDGASIGASGNLGSKTFDVGKLGDGDNAGAEVSLGGSLKFAYGSTWEFTDMDQWTAMKDDLDEYLVQQESVKHDTGGGYALYLSLFGKWVDPPKDPKITFAKIGIEAALKASAGTRLGTGEVDADGKETLINPQLGFNLSTTAGGSVVVMNNQDTGSKSYTYELTGTGTVGGDVILGHVTGTGTVTGAFTTTYDKDGRLSELAFKSAYEYGASGSLGNKTFKSVSGGVAEGETRSVVTTTKLSVTDENRAEVEAWIADRSGVTGEALSLPVNALVPDRPSDDPFLQLLYEEARTSQMTYHNVKDSWEFGMAVKKGWELGFTVSAEEATATATDGTFLGAPGQDGTRVQVADDECDGGA